MAFGKLSDINNTLQTLDYFEGLSVSIDRPEVIKLIIRLNTDGQLFYGVDSTNTDLEDIGGAYTEYTVYLKKLEGLPYDRVTLFQTGEFYESFIVEVEKDGFTIFANTIKVDDEGFAEDLRERWGQNILGLTPESKATLIQQILPHLRNWLINSILE